MKPYRQAPEDSREWKCSWLRCAGGEGLAGSGWCPFKGDWNKKDCKFFLTEEEFWRKSNKMVQTNEKN